MKLSILSRLLHRRGAILTGLPLLLVIGSGILLQVKKQVSWVQPTEQRTDTTRPLVPWDQMLAAARAVPEADVQDWSDIDRVDVRPGKGILKVVSKSGWELQMALGTGELLQTAYRRSDLIETLHDGSFFGDAAMYLVFLPAGVILFGLWMTGLYLWFLPTLTRRRRARLARTSPP